MVNDMKKKRNIRGFTMAELLIVVAVITVLSGVGFVAVQSHRKALEQSEANTIAKEIFFAAQNHLTMAESEGYLADSVGSSFYGTSTSRLDRDDTKAKDIYYFSVSGSSAFGGNTVLDLMLPFGSIDDTIRLSGNYVIRYQANPARVLDVWYGKSGKVTLPAIGELVGITTGRNGIGYYGGDAALESGVTLDVPSIEVQNAERLIVTVKGTEGYSAIVDSEGQAVSLKLLITGETSKAMAAIPILQNANNRVATENGSIVVTLDDITKPYVEMYNDGYHFADIAKGPGASGSQIIVEAGENGTFIPGENIKVQAVAFSTRILASIAYSNEVTTNSLFADIEDASTAGITGVTSGKVAMISNIRQLENLDSKISKVNTIGTTGSNPFIITGAKQIEDLCWADSQTNSKAFTQAITTAGVYQIKKEGETEVGTAPGCYLPVNIGYALVYDGAYTEGTGNTPVKKCHSITGVKVAGSKNANSGADTPFSGDGGLFGTVTGALTVQNLELIDFSINCTGNAGALAGTFGTEDVATKAINVLARNSTADATATDISGTGDAGGLIGKMLVASDGGVERCAAALVVSSTNGNAGGLIGASNGGSMKASYSGGHAVEKKQGQTVVGVGYDSDAFNVTGKTCAGGLIGNAGGTHIESSYSTCSASGSVAGGLVGEAEGNITGCYCTGLVEGSSKAGAFAGIKSKGSVNSCSYFEIINPKETTLSGTTYKYLLPVDGSASVTGITAFDADAATFDTFCFTPQASDTWINPEPYDTELSALYKIKPNSGDATSYYPLKTVKQLGAENIVETATATTPADFVATHYGDWPAPEILVVNTKSGSQNQNTNP